MTNEQIEIEFKHLATKEDLALLKSDISNLRAEIYKAFGDFKADLLKTIWLTQLSVIGVILVAVGLMIHFKI